MPPKSPFWKYFENLSNGTARCRSCSKIIKTCGNTTNLKLHVTKMHPNLLKDEEPAENTRQNVSRKSSNTSAAKQVDLINEKSSQPTLTSSVRNINDYACHNAPKAIRINNAILYMMCKDSQPMQMVENEGFIHLMRVCAPLYKLPSRFYFKRMIEDKYKICKNLFTKEIEKSNSICITTDIWTETMQCKSFLGVTIHFLNGKEIASGNLGVRELSESHTAEYVSSILLETLADWEICSDKVFAIITDAGPNIKKASEIAFGSKKHIICFAHMLNLVGQKSIESIANLNELISAVKKIVTWFKHSVVASDELRKVTELKLIQEVSTRWNSTFYMIERFLELRPHINNIINNHTSAPPMLTARHILELTEVSQVLRPLEIATIEICGEKFVTMSKVIPLSRMLYTKVGNLQPTQILSKALKKSLLFEIEKRLLPSEKNNLLAVGTLLDPRFKNVHFHDALQCSKAINTVKGMLKDASTPVLSSEIDDKVDNDDDLWSEHYKIVKNKNIVITEDTTMPTELSLYLKSPLLHLKQDPLENWCTVLEAQYPNLKNIALQYLSCVATSTPSERLFSKAGLIMYQQWNRLKGMLLSTILFLQTIDKKYWEL